MLPIDKQLNCCANSSPQKEMEIIMERSDTIERTITVASPIERVWQALTTADMLAQWFGDSAEVDLRPGGAMKVGWSGYGTTVDCVIDDVDPPRTFSYRWESAPADDGQTRMTHVQFTLAHADGETTVTVIESGLAALPDELYGKTLEENTSGWKAEMDDLAHLVETAAAH